MKKFLIISALALVAMCACTKSEVTTPDEQISFAPATYVSQTKGDDDPDGCTPGHFKLTKPFGVYAWYYTAADATAQTFMSNQQVDTDGTTVDMTYYWPKTGTIDFIGYYPYDADGSWFNLSSNPTATITSGAIPIDPSYDLMYSDKAPGYGYNETVKNGKSQTHFTTGVPMLFHHALTQLTVIFKAAKVNDKKTTTFAIEVTSAKFSGIYTKGTFSATLDSEGKATPTKTEGAEVWMSPSTPSYIDITPDNTLNDGAGETVITNYSVLPQRLLKDTQKLELNFKVTTTYNDGNKTWSIVEPKTAAIDLNTIQYTTGTGATKQTQTLEDWEMNKRIVYTIIIDPVDTSKENIVKFDPAVVDWETVDSATITTSGTGATE